MVNSYAFRNRKTGIFPVFGFFFNCFENLESYVSIAKYFKLQNIWMMKKTWTSNDWKGSFVEIICCSHWTTCIYGWIYLLCKDLNEQSWNTRLLVFKACLWCIKYYTYMWVSVFVTPSFFSEETWGNPIVGNVAWLWKEKQKVWEYRPGRKQNGDYNKGTILFVSFFCKTCRSCSLQGLSCWDRIDEDEADLVAAEVQLDPNLLPLVSGESDDQVLRFYWLDAYEDQFSQPGNCSVKGRKCHSHSFCSVGIFRLD